MPIEYRFDDLDLREEPANALGREGSDSESYMTKCITTTTLPTNYSCNTCTC